MLDLVIEGTRKDLGGGLEVGRVLPFARRRMVGPFIFLDHMGPADFRSGEGIAMGRAAAIQVGRIPKFRVRLLHLCERSRCNESFNWC